MKQLLTKLAGGLALLFLLPLTVFAQEGSISGTVTDAETGEPLPGANVVIQDLNMGAATNAEGSYAIDNVPAGEHTLRASFVGYESSEQQISIAAGEEVVQDIALVPDYAGLEEVVVTGIASRTSRARAEVAVSSVDVEDLTDQNSYTGMADLLSGKVSGLNVKKSSGNIGGGFRFDVRSGGGLSGSGQPVIYIDGVRAENADVEGFGTGGQGVSTLSYLNPEDIENIEVLKGPAAAALYGTSGSNGVILITTKTGGGAGETFSVRYKSTLGVNQQVEEYTYETSATPDVANAFYRDGLINKQSISVSGGADLVSYFASYQYSDEEGTLPNNQQKLNSFRANFEAYPVEDVTLRATAGYSKNNISRPQNDNNIYGYLGNTMLSPSPYVFVGGDSTALGAIDNIQRNNQFVGSVELSYTPFDNLELQASVGYEGIEVRNDETILADAPIGTVVNGERSIFERRNEQFTYDFNARYSYGILDDLQATTVAGFQAFDRTLRSFFIGKQNFSTALITNVGAGSDFIQGDESFINTREAGIFAQQEVAYQDRYFLTVGLRQDFATTIGEGAASIFYPKVSGAVRLDQFDFAPDYTNLFKLRAAYGETGQLPGRLDAIPFLYEAEPSAYGAGGVLDFIGNPNIEPERVRELEVGLDAEFANRLGLGLTYYRQNATGSPIDFENAPSTGKTASDVPFNIGEKTGQGVEAEVDYTVFRTQSNALTLNAKYAYQTNTVESLGGAQPIRGGFDVVYTLEDYPQYSFYAVRSEAEFNDEGEFVGIVPVATDENGAPQREFLGTPVPGHSGAFSVNFRFLDDFSFYGLVDFAADQKVYNGTRYYQGLYGGIKDRNVAAYRLGLPFLGEEFDYSDPSALEGANYGYLTEYGFGELDPGTEAYRDAAQTYASLATSVTSGGVSVVPDGNFVSDAGFIKLREISLSYDISDLINSLGGLGAGAVNRASFAVSARNLLTFTPYTGVDPEVNFAGSRGQTRGNDFLTLAPPRTITGTLMLRF